MLFSWFSELRRQNRLASEPFPEEWEHFLHADMPHYEYLSPDEQKHLRDHVQIFVAEKNWEALGGLTLTDEIRVSIAAQACLLLLGLEHHDFYPNVESVLVYPSGYKASAEQAIAAGVVQVGESFRLGEAWGRGPVVLSWSDALRGGRDPNDGHNVVLHEFAHKLDMQRGGSADGVPVLPGGQDQYDEWAEVMSQEYDDLVAQSKHGRADLLDVYGATNPAEFFAVSTEAFFEKPRQMRERHARLYEVLKGYYRQDTAARIEAAQAQADAQRAAERAEAGTDEATAEAAGPDSSRGEHYHPRPHAHDVSGAPAEVLAEQAVQTEATEATEARVTSYLDRLRVTDAPAGAGTSADAG